MFNWEDFKLGKFAVSCSSVKLATSFLEACDRKGICWSSGESTGLLNCWGSHRDMSFSRGITNNECIQYQYRSGLRVGKVGDTEGISDILSWGKFSTLSIGHIRAYQERVTDLKRRNVLREEVAFALPSTYEDDFHALSTELKDRFSLSDSQTLDILDNRADAILDILLSKEES